MSEVINSKLQELLNKHWGHENFRKYQLSIIKSIVEGRDTVVILPTGGGKSLCYQLPATFLNSLVIVVSPLIALMKNQVDFLQEKGIKAAFLNSTLSRKQVEEIKQDILSEKLNILYIAPETLNKKDMIAFLKQVTLSFIAIDEAHCISDWGHDFRPEYRKLKQTIEKFGALPIIALTATATPQVQKDIMHSLEMKDPNICVSSFDRANLYYQVSAKVQVRKKLIRFIRQQANPIGIVYCQSRKSAEELADFLQQNDFLAAPYHAGLDHSIRERNQNDFLVNNKRIIVATIAFGMGIDKPDVGFIVHYDSPKSLEGYYQETGRAGRNGKPANCLLFYDPKDVGKFSKFNNNKPITQKKKLDILLNEVQSYALTSVCRRKHILHYFGEEHPGDCNLCDNCKRERESYDGKDFIKQALEAVKETHEQHHASYIAKILAGNESADITGNNDHMLPIFGKGKDHATLWGSVIRQAILHGYLVRDTEEVATLKITPKGHDFFENPLPTLLYKDQVYDFSEKGDENEHYEKKELPVDSELLEQLIALRDKEASKRNIMPYLVFQEAILKHMAIYYPTTIEALTTIQGIGPGKAQKFGEPFVKLIAAHTEKHAIEPPTMVVSRISGSKLMGRVQIIQQIDKKIPLERIAKIRKISYQELIKELELLSDTGVQVKLEYHINKILSEEEQEDLYDYFQNIEKDDIELACRELEDDYDEDQVRLMRIQFLAEVAN